MLFSFCTYSKRFEILDAELDAFDAIIGTLVFDRNVAVVARLLEDGDATLYGNVALTDRASDKSAASAGVISRFEILVEFVNEPVLCVDVESIGRVLRFRGESYRVRHALMRGEGPAQKA